MAKKCVAYATITLDEMPLSSILCEAEKKIALAIKLALLALILLHCFVKWNKGEEILSEFMQDWVYLTNMRS